MTVSAKTSLAASVEAAATQAGLTVVSVSTGADFNGQPTSIFQLGLPAAPDRTLGFVLMFSDLTERKAAEAARRRFQEVVLEQRRPMAGMLDSKADLVFRNLLSTVVENAQLAALEIADGVDPSRIPDMLETVRASVTRTAEMLRYFIWHAAGGDDGG